MCVRGESLTDRPRRTRYVKYIIKNLPKRERHTKKNNRTDCCAVLHIMSGLYPYRVTRQRGGAWVDLVSFHAHAAPAGEPRTTHTRSNYYYYYYYHRLSRQPPRRSSSPPPPESQSHRVSSATHSCLVRGQAVLLYLCLSVFLYLYF